MYREIKSFVPDTEKVNISTMIQNQAIMNSTLSSPAPNGFLYCQMARFFR